MKHADRFWSKVLKTDTCWLWQSCKNKLGYGAFFLNGRNRPAYRVAYELVRGPVPQGLVLDHVCRVPACVNPDHLEPVTQAENVRRGLICTRQMCKHGHTLVRGKWQRFCPMCRIEVNRRYRLKRAPVVPANRGDLHYLRQHPERARGSLNNCAKLTESQVAAMRAEFAAGVKQSVLAVQYGVSEGSVWKIVHWKTWVQHHD